MLLRVLSDLHRIAVVLTSSFDDFARGITAVTRSDSLSFRLIFVKHARVPLGHC